MDIVSKKKRSEMMSNIKGKNTLPEMMVRNYLYSKGYRYKIHEIKLPGKPDIVLANKKIAIEVRGCFWHGHQCRLASIPRTNRSFWIKKIYRNKQRDNNNSKKIRKIGYNLIVVHECRVRKGNYKKLLLKQIKKYA
jgi:DNA mismatch endonuclease (patch repair protein)|tara:strand:+ start:80 stop:487 length:408 start_codon:yes stop_codon:yes gene_type:complete